MSGVAEIRFNISGMPKAQKKSPKHKNVENFVDNFPQNV
jgi:hypothetical protein